VKFRVRDVLESIEESDLRKMQADLSKGGLFLKKLIDDQLKEMENKKLGFCVTCGKEIVTKRDTYTLLFGPEDFKKKASFCELDCMEYFLSGLKKSQEFQGENDGVQRDNQDI